MSGCKRLVKFLNNNSAAGHLLGTDLGPQIAAGPNRQASGDAAAACRAPVRLATRLAPNRSALWGKTIVALAVKFRGWASRVASGESLVEPAC